MSATPGGCAVHALQAWVDKSRLSAGYVLCEEKSNEIEALPRLLESLQLTGAIVTVDAMGNHTHVSWLLMSDEPG